jgi:hypothetical protein
VVFCCFSWMLELFWQCGFWCFSWMLELFWKCGILLFFY